MGDQRMLGANLAKAQSVTAHGDQTARSSVFDVLRGLDWPHPYDFRALRNEIHRQWEHQVAELKHYPDNAQQITPKDWPKKTTPEPT